jgi:hypothetical protein
VPLLGHQGITNRQVAEVNRAFVPERDILQSTRGQRFPVPGPIRAPFGNPTADPSRKRNLSGLLLPHARQCPGGGNEFAPQQQPRARHLLGDYRQRSTRPTLPAGTAPASNGASNPGVSRLTSLPHSGNPDAKAAESTRCAFFSDVISEMLGWIGWMGRGHVESAYKKL